MQTPKAASEPLLKLLKSAVANAENNFSMDPDKLYVPRSTPPGPDPQARPPEPARAALSASTREPLTSPSSWREGIREEDSLWDRKLIPTACACGVIKDWDSRWYARNEKVGDLIVEDYKIRKYLKKTLYGAGVPKIEIERNDASPCPYPSTAPVRAWSSARAARRSRSSAPRSKP